MSPTPSPANDLSTASTTLPDEVAATLPWLVADIGGTNARFGWIDDPAEAARHSVAQVKTLPVADHATLGAAAQAYLAGLAEQARAAGRPWQPPRKAALAVATPITGDQVSFTNSPWSFSRQALQADLGLQALLVLNDFEALALSLPTLGAAQLRPHAALPQAQGTLAVLGPGTGLGVGAVTRTPSGWQALPGEGGHVTLAAANDFEAEILRLARREFEHVSAERFLSGTGLPTMHLCVAEALGQPSPELTPPEIIERGLSGQDAACSRTIDTFCAMLGGVAGNLALTLGARGGVFIGGGIVPRLGERFYASEFRARFEAKGRFRGYLEGVPTALITDTLAALRGTALALLQHRSR
ncbi:glucokinase [Sphaerotilus microaerophilus]|uniref:Glucokinase n=1 Tax=Sphaerotilus microaerophilus TaxID=2914710 RepID=A0ABM7YM35_9BURK|nr:glucokinase [Sphaerotilus sp. FB-5]BDI05452.1 glucokinase [Sphaerotilus sp. FB-5]